jgi:hypothetical protein
MKKIESAVRARVLLSDTADGSTLVETMFEIPVPDQNGKPFTLFRSSGTRIILTRRQYWEAALYPEIARVIAADFRRIAEMVERHMRYARHLHYPKTALNGGVSD